MHCNTVSALLEHVAHSAHHFFFKAVVSHIQKRDFSVQRSVVFYITSNEQLGPGLVRRSQQ